MSARDVVELMDRLEENHVEAWLDGGWGIDALLGAQTREHDDIDLVLSTGDAPALIELLARAGYRLMAGDPFTNFVLLDELGRQVDVHPVRFSPEGDGIYRMETGGDWVFPAQAFTGRGRVDGRPVRCLSPEVQLLCHAGYELDDEDRRDLQALHERFGVELPFDPT
jgi:lincosamide nucleotidyltransferase A/C/D/E